MTKSKNEEQAEVMAAVSTEQQAIEVPPTPEEHTPVVQEPVNASPDEPEAGSIKAETHSKKRNKKATVALPVFVQPQNKWVKIGGLVAGVLALLLIVVSGIASQYFKGRVMPGVSVAGVSSVGKRPADLKKQLESQKQKFAVTFQAEGKTFKPSLKEIGYQVDVNKTVQNALSAKRREGLMAKITFWKNESVPAAVTINDNLLNQYLEANTPSLTKAPTDAQLQFDVNSSTFVITNQADGQGPDLISIKKQLSASATDLKSSNVKIVAAKRVPNITEAKLQPLVQPANDLVSRQVVLSGLGYTYRARPVDIASWLTPTPQADGRVKLIIDSAKVQSYVESIGKKISSPPQDKKVVKDETTGQEVVLQEGRDGTELADRQSLAMAIAQALKNGQDASQTMNITTAAYKTVNMSAYDKWIEVDLSEQRTTAYERATPVKSFTVATGVAGHDTVVGEFAIWLKVRSQTMTGGSRASGDYYDIPNVEWVSYFYQDYALHGAWWRKVFGYPASHGCVNMTNEDAQWIYEWAPVGTKVIVHR